MAVIVVGEQKPGNLLLTTGNICRPPSATLKRAAQCTEPDNDDAPYAHPRSRIRDSARLTGATRREPRAVTDLFVNGSVRFSDDEIALFDDVITRLALQIEVWPGHSLHGAWRRWPKHHPTSFERWPMTMKSVLPVRFLRSV